MPDSESVRRFGPALTLSYDGADPSHLETVLPCLAQRELRATFYVHEIGLLENPQAWQAAQNEGHEIACHSLFAAADPFGNLPKWTLENVEADLRDARKLITELFPRQGDFSFAYPGVEAQCMTIPYEPVLTPYRPVVDRLFQVARSAREGLVDFETCDVLYLESIDARDLKMDDLIVAAESALFEEKWAIFAFRGIGSGEGAVDAAAHEALCDWAAEHRDTVRAGPVYEIAMNIREKRLASEGAYSWTLQQNEP
jgi:peptidoglycan/xylan/chitin deacetylase (PgdA/CDA1 family)